MGVNENAANVFGIEFVFVINMVLRAGVESTKTVNCQCDEESPY